MPWVIRPITADHDVDGFDCGTDSLNSWLRQHALPNDRLGLSKVHVLTEAGSDLVLGYYALSSFHVISTDIPDSKKRGIPQKDFRVPCHLIGRIAVDEAEQKKGLGAILLAHAMTTAYQASKGVAAYAIVVETRDPVARAFWVKHDFTPLLTDLNHLFMPMSRVELIVKGM